MAVAILTPTGADASNARDVLSTTGITSVICSDVNEMIGLMEKGCGGVLVAEEAVNKAAAERMNAILSAQKPWSDLPIILVTTGGNAGGAASVAVRLIGAQWNLNLLERPLRATTLIAALQTALRSRKRQYEIRGLLLERQILLETMEKRVEERTAKLKLSLEELEAFSYSVSHDLRAPLRALDGYAQALLEDCSQSLSSDAQEYARQISKAAKRMDQLTHDILTYAKISRSAKSADLVDLDSVLVDVIGQYPSITPWQSYITVCSPLGKVHGNRSALVQCFSNLLENALKFTAPDEKPAITVASHNIGPYLRVSVRDNGIGIDPKHHQRIFAMFERVHRQEFSGTGIGLSIVKKAIERMDGTIGVFSEIGKGSTFWIQLPNASVVSPSPTLLTSCRTSTEIHE